MEYLKQTGIHSPQLRAPLNGIPQTHKRMMRKRRWQTRKTDTYKGGSSQTSVHWTTWIHNVYLWGRLSSFVFEVHYHLPTLPAFVFYQPSWNKLPCVGPQGCTTGGKHVRRIQEWLDASTCALDHMDSQALPLGST